jgi:hypothetical protein
VAAALAFILTKTVFDPLAAAHVLPQWAMLILNFPAAINGAIIGLFQRQAFRKGQPRTWRWVLACSMGLYFFWLVLIADSSPAMSLIHHAGMAIGFDYNFNIFILANFVNCLSAGVVFGGITVRPLERILRLYPASAASPAQTLPSE